MTFTVRNVDILLLHIHKVEELVVQPAVAALAACICRRIVLVYAEYFHISEGHLPLIVQPDKLPVEGQRSGPGGKAQPENAPRMFPDGRYDDFRNRSAGGFRIFEYLCRNLLVAVENIFRQAFFNQPAILWQRKMFHILKI